MRTVYCKCRSLVPPEAVTNWSSRITSRNPINTLPPSWHHATGKTHNCKLALTSASPNASDLRVQPIPQVELTHNTTSPPHPDWKCGARYNSSHPLDFRRFRVLLTLFSKSFSPFPYGTCALSDYHIYLAFDGVYHRLKVALSSNPTLGRQLVRGGHSITDGVLTLSDSRLPTNLDRGHTLSVPP